MPSHRPIDSSERIAYLTSVYPQGTDTFIRVEIEHLTRLGFDIRRFSIRRPERGSLVGEAVLYEFDRTHYLLAGNPGRSLVQIMMTAISHPLRLAAALALMWRTGEPGLRGRLRHVAYLLEAMLLSRLMELNGVGHLHNHFGENSATVAMLASCISGIPYSLTLHGCYIFFHPRRWALGEKIARSAFTACVSHFCKSQCMVFTPERAWDRLHLVRCCVAPQFLGASLVPVPEAARFLCVGRLCTEKGVPLLLEAVRRLLEDQVDVNLAMIGDGPLRPGIEEQISKLGLTDHVVLSGSQDSSYVRRAIEDARALVLPSLAEGLPVVIMEAMALGRPVIATRVGGIGELVEHRRNGWLVDPASVEALTEALREVIHAPVRQLEAMGKAGAARVADLHDVRKEAAKLAALFRKTAVDPKEAKAQ